MFRERPHDLHMHLNGSFSYDFLKRTAIKNQCLPTFEKLEQVSGRYRSLINTGMTNSDSIKLIWEQFSLIHQIVKTLEDVKDGTIDVITHSKAGYLEIRTTPKAIQAATWEDYVSKFEAGIRLGNASMHGKRLARGLLSLDRTLHDEQMADEIIKRVAESDVLVGVDISGNPEAPRKLTGLGLRRVLSKVLNHTSMGIAIHVGETESLAEREDVNIVLEELELWQKKQTIPQASYFPRVRLGHGIYLTDQHRQKIRELKIPVEICPSCHRQMNWSQQDQLHPVRNIYQRLTDPVVPGTDDITIFGADAEAEGKAVQGMLENPDQLTNEEINLHHAQFRFS